MLYPRLKKKWFSNSDWLHMVFPPMSKVGVGIYPFYVWRIIVEDVNHTVLPKLAMNWYKLITKLLHTVSMLQE